eukprot:5536718-Prymnesium_polylepis.3
MCPNAVPDNMQRRPLFVIRRQPDARWAQAIARHFMAHTKRDATCDLPDCKAAGAQLFSELDTDQSGSLSKDELKAAADKYGTDIGAKWPGTPSVEELLVKYDANGDGMLCKAECVHTSLGRHKASCGAAFETVMKDLLKIDKGKKPAKPKPTSAKAMDIEVVL